MGQKDLTEKSLESYPDVFVDTINALLYHGKAIVEAAELQPAPTETLYPGRNGELHSQFHDISKYVVKEGRIKVQYTLENETGAKRKTVLRKAGYEGAIYRGQYDGAENYPVISCILHWGKRPWRQPRSLHQLWRGQEISQEMQEYIDDIKLYVYDMRHLSQTVRTLFKSDMRIIVDYLAEGEKYVPTQQKIVHVEAVLRLLKELTGDTRYEEIISEVINVESDEGGITMCELLDKYENRGIAKGISLGISQGISVGRLEDLRNMMETLKLTAEQAMAALKIPDGERAEYLAKL